MLSSMWICCEYCIISLIIAEEKPKPTSIYNCTFTVETMYMVLDALANILLALYQVAIL